MLDRLKTILSHSHSDPHVDVEGEMVPVRINRTSRARRILLRADTVRREIRVTVPSHVPTAVAMDFVVRKKQWIAARLQSAPDAVPLIPWAEIAVEGETCRISWQNGRTRRVELAGDELRVGGPEDMVARRVLAWLKGHARKVFLEDLEHYCARAGENVPRLSLGDPRSRWGSCSTRGTISLSWRLIMAPPHVRRSVIAHEVAHMRHMDHSPDFYIWLDTIFEGDRKSADRWLKMHGVGLHLIGR